MLLVGGVIVLDGQLGHVLLHLRQASHEVWIWVEDECLGLGNFLGLVHKEVDLAFLDLVDLARLLLLLLLSWDLKSGALVI